MATAVAPFSLDGVAERESHRGTAALASAIAAAGGVACALSMAAPALRGLPLHPLDQTIHAGVAAAYIGAGVVAVLRRPGNATGLLMAAVGFLWLVNDLVLVRRGTAVHHRRGLRLARHPPIVQTVTIGRLGV